MSGNKIDRVRDWIVKIVDKEDAHLDNYIKKSKWKRVKPETIKPTDKQKGRGCTRQEKRRINPVGSSSLDAKTVKKII